MSAEFPTSVYTPRETENLPGIEYDADQKRFFYSEDFQNLGNEINAVEEFLHPVSDFSGQAGKVLKVNDAEDALEFGTGGTGGGAWGEITGDILDQTDLQDEFDTKQTILGYTAENVANKQTDLTASATKYPTVNAVIDGLNSLWSLAVSTFQTALGFTPENVANKQTDLTASATKYPTVDAVNAGLLSQISQQRWKIFNGLGSNILAWALGYTWDNLDGGGSTTSGTIFFNPVYLTAGQIITGVKWYQFTAGVYTANNYNGFGLYSYSAGVLTLVASTTNDGNIFKATSKTVANKDFSASYTVPTSGTYFIAMLRNSSAQTTNPSIGGVVGFSQTLTFAFDFTNSATLHPTLASQTSLPSPLNMSSLADSTNRYVWGLY